MGVTTLQQGVVVYIGWTDDWDVMGVLSRWAILLTSHWVEAVVLVPVAHTGLAVSECRSWGYVPVVASARLLRFESAGP